MMPDVEHILKKYWGYDAFRSIQRDIIDSVLQGHDTLGLMPTGGGKSITFQVPGLALGGLTLVVTPLVSLMKDQVDNLSSRGIRAAYLHSGLTYRETRNVWDKIINGNCRFLYVSPERLQNENFCIELRALKKIKLIVVDEAHCISQWGYDFRPSYLNISRLRHLMPDVAFMALTASATPEVEKDICRLLEFKNPQVFRAGFKRENITYVVRYTDAKLDKIRNILSSVAGSAIVYVRSRRRTVEIASALNDFGFTAAPYHAGLAGEVKEERQNSWKRGDIRVMVATNAFGMGIDKPDVRFVIHHDIPGSIEEYYQEAGRAGRDGELSYAVMLAAKIDKSVLRRRVSEAFPERDKIRLLYEWICNFINVSLGEGYQKIYEFNITRFCDIYQQKESVVRSALKILSGAGYLELVENPNSFSRVMITCEREELYNLPDDPAADILLRTLLRTYSGLFTDYVAVSEYKLSQLTGFSSQQLYDAFLRLTRQKVLHYIPRKNIPYIYVLTSREEPQYILIPHTVYEDRKAAMLARVEAMIDYAFDTDRCRSLKILNYFGEKSGDGCNTCDVCRDAHTPLSGKGRDSLRTRLIDYLDAAPSGLTPASIFYKFGARTKEVGELLEFLIDEGVVAEKNGLYHLQK